MTARRPEESGERLHGIGISPGVAVGRALVLEGRRVDVVRVDLHPSRISQEVARFQRAIRGAWRQLRRLRDQVRAEAGDACASVFQAQILVLKDRALLKETIALVRRERANAEWAFHTVVGRYAEAFDQLEEADLRERGTDLEDVEMRVQSILTGSRRRHDLADLSDDVIVVSATLAPSDVASLNRAHVVGLATDGGGPTSHAAIIASALGVPAVAGLREASARLRTGDLLILDGAEGIVVRNPAEAEIALWGERRERLAEQARDLGRLRDEPATTRDGVRVALLANIELPEEMEAARRHGAEGVGLYRSEFLFLKAAPALPDEEQHYLTYRGLAERASPHEVVIRTLDLGGDKLLGSVTGRREAIPVLGLRGVRLGLKRPDLFRAQLRGILRAAVHGKVRLMLPMVTGLEEVRQALDLLNGVRDDLAREGVPCASDVPIGIMIEVPAAALIADRLARLVDFFSLGTNDLIQYALAVDRGAESVSYLYEPLHPAILSLVAHVAEAARRHGRRLSVCGEMAADPIGAVALVGLGITELSMSPAAIPAIKRVIRGVSLREARAMIDEAFLLDTASAIQDMFRRRLLSLMPAEHACPT